MIKERLRDSIKVFLMMCIPIITISFSNNYKDNSYDRPTLTIATPLESNDISFLDKSAEEGLLESLNYYNIKHPDIVYAQAILETGNFKSRACIKDNNLFGLYNSKTKTYYKFNHWAESVLAYKRYVQYRYSSGNYYKFLVRINYAEDTRYINKLKKIVNDKRRYKERDTIS